MTNPKFKIGTKYKTRGKHPKVCTVVDIHTTTNIKGDVVKIRYVSEHTLMGQAIRSEEVETTIAMGLIEQKKGGETK